ncbi:hypothetical protein M8818_004018 [Zalaria obscura]|uniref:Uncharacterized protein n=1 Tax=Zalaria obscura TaxID=2024903 RepID=A0ACC3SDB8_9PEZI
MIATLQGVASPANGSLWTATTRPTVPSSSRPTADMTSTSPEDLIPRFKFERLLRQDQAGCRIVLLGTITSQPALLLAERAAFPSDSTHLTSFPTSLSHIKNLGDNDIYRWYLACTSPSSSSPPGADADALAQPHDLKINLIYPCTSSHVKKYSAQGVRLVTETAAIYAAHIRPYMRAKREEGRLNWVFNILEGRTEQEDVLFRSPPDTPNEERFLMLPDLNWDRKTVGSLHLLALVERRDIWSVRDLRKGMVGWLRTMRERLGEVVVGMYGERGVEGDMLKFYVHYQPTYYHFHIHVVHVGLEAGATQAVGKALSLENIIGQLETMAGGDEAGMADVDLSYTLGEASELWTEIYLPLKEGRKPTVP